MNKLLIALCLTASFGVSAETKTYEQQVNEVYEVTLKQGRTHCEFTRETLVKFKLPSHLAEEHKMICLSVMDSLNKASILKGRIDK